MTGAVTKTDVSGGFTVVAIIAAHNEADLIEQVITDLVDQGVSVYFLDDHSTDGTREIVERFVGRGVLQVERLDSQPGVFDWERILRRKAELASTLDADWFIHHDADEFRESPWLGVPLSQAIAHVDALGYNAIDFALLEFWPVDDAFQPGRDVREAHRYYAMPQPYDRIRISCWKKGPMPVELAMSGGHEAFFEGRDVFPVSFLLRHYPVRSQTQGARKVFAERRPRYMPSELARGWHVQYATLRESQSFLRSPSSLTLYDPIVIRRTLLSRRSILVTEQAESAPRADLSAEGQEIEHRLRDVARCRRQLAQAASMIEEQRAALAKLRNELHGRETMIATLQRQLADTTMEMERLAQTLEEGERRLHDLRQSLSWRWTAPVRAAFRVLTRREF